MFLIAYDKQSGRNYHSLSNAIESLGECWHYLESTWLLNANHTTGLIADYLRSYISENERLLVIEVNPYSCDGWLPESAWDWIRGTAALKR